MPKTTTTPITTKSSPPPPNIKLESAPRIVPRFEEFRKVVKARATAMLTEGNDGEENAWCITDGNKVEGEFDDTGGSRNDSVATEVVGEIVAKEVVPGVEGKVP
ncbi:hypothetical protein glysoja_035710 [Glycine soja]|uniref:Uncharacterized protein n=1 Tax=Glycine soja TaxID=3848 RepID=A0A0B2QE44_GLYSO|nr:hypothetical protein glysoja_035710 [Glycine soja]